jgi:hypothetical protein
MLRDKGLEIKHGEWQNGGSPGRKRGTIADDRDRMLECLEMSSVLFLAALRAEDEEGWGCRHGDL